jgi:hypothetical protein
MVVSPIHVLIFGACLAHATGNTVTERGFLLRTRSAVTGLCCGVVLSSDAASAARHHWRNSLQAGCDRASQIPRHSAWVGTNPRT